MYRLTSIIHLININYESINFLLLTLRETLQCIHLCFTGDYRQACVTHSEQGFTGLQLQASDYRQACVTHSEQGFTGLQLQASDYNQACVTHSEQCFTGLLLLNSEDYYSEEQHNRTRTIFKAD